MNLTAVDVYKASAARSSLYQAVNKLFDHYDYLALPTAQVFPFDVNIPWPKEIGGSPWMRTIAGWRLPICTPSGCPVANVPVGFNAAGLPMGLQIIGRSRADLAVLQLAYAYEQQAAGWGRGRAPVTADQTVLICPKVFQNVCVP